MHLSRFKSCFSPWLDSWLDRWLSIEVYETQFFRTDFHPIREHLFRLSFLTTLNIYKDYFEGCKKLHKLHECEAKLCSCKLWSETEFSLVYLSPEEAAVFVHLRVLWPRNFVIFIVWWIEELCSQHLSQVVYWDSAHLLISYVLGAVHWKWEIVKFFELVYLKIWGDFCEYYKLILCIST